MPYQPMFALSGVGPSPLIVDASRAGSWVVQGEESVLGTFEYPAEFRADAVALVRSSQRPVLATPTGRCGYTVRSRCCRAVALSVRDGSGTPPAPVASRSGRDPREHKGSGRAMHLRCAAR